MVCLVIFNGMKDYCLSFVVLLLVSVPSQCTSWHLSSSVTVNCWRSVLTQMLSEVSVLKVTALGYTE